MHICQPAPQAHLAMCKFRYCLFISSALCASYHFQSFLHAFFLCFLFRSCYSNAQVFGRTLVHEFHVFYSHTERNLFFFTLRKQWLVLERIAVKLKLSSLSSLFLACFTFSVYSCWGVFFPFFLPSFFDAVLMRKC